MLVIHGDHINFIMLIISIPFRISRDVIVLVGFILIVTPAWEKEIFRPRIEIIAVFFKPAVEMPVDQFFSYKSLFQVFFCKRIVFTWINHFGHKSLLTSQLIEFNLKN